MRTIDRLALVAVLTLTAGACRGLSTGAGGGTGSGTTAGGTAALVGTWRRTLVVEHNGDFTSSETTWLFASDGSCERIVATTTVSAGFTDTVHSPCSFSVVGGIVNIRYDGTTGSVTFGWSVQGSTLFLDGVAFQRI